MKNLFSKIFKDENSFVWNAIIWGFLAAIFYIILLSPFVIIAMFDNTEVLNDATEIVYLNKSELYVFLDSLIPIFAFGIVGGVAEMFRRMISIRKKQKSNNAINKNILIGMIYIVLLVFLHVAVSIALRYV